MEDLRMKFRNVNSFVIFDVNWMLIFKFLNFGTEETKTMANDRVRRKNLNVRRRNLLNVHDRSE